MKGPVVPIQFELAAKMGDERVEIGAVQVDVPLTLTPVPDKPTSFIVGVELANQLERALRAFVREFESGAA